mgnify:CR=1
MNIAARIAFLIKVQLVRQKCKRKSEKAMKKTFFKHALKKSKIDHFSFSFAAVY